MSTTADIEVRMAYDLHTALFTATSLSTIPSQVIHSPDHYKYKEDPRPYVATHLLPSSSARLYLVMPTSSTLPTNISATMAAPWLPSSQSGRLSFFDLAAETRNQIYHHLFDGQLIHIREKDDGDEIEEQPEDWPNKPHGVPPKWLIIRRNKAMGLNLLLASKQWLAEAKPILLNSATFDIKVDSWAEASPVKGFSIHDLRNTRFLRYQTNAQHIGELAYAASSICQSSLATVTGLCKVEIYSSRTLTLPYKSYGLDTLDVSLKDPVILELLHRAFLKPGSEYKAAFDHMQKRAKTDHAEAILKQCLYLKGSRTVSISDVQGLNAY